MLYILVTYFVDLFTKKLWHMYYCLQGLNLKYKMTMTNGESIFFKHFSADEFCKWYEILLLIIFYYIFVISEGYIAMCQLEGC